MGPSPVRHRPARILYRLPDAVSFDTPRWSRRSRSIHAVSRSPQPLGKSAAVVGTGIIGLLLIQAARAAGFGQILAIDVDPDRLTLARSLGADERFLPVETGRGHRERTGGKGAEVVFEVVGSADTLTTAVQSAAKGGSVVLVGNLTPQVPLPLQSVVTREITLLGSCASCGEYPLCLDLLAGGAIRVEPLISAWPLAAGRVVRPPVCPRKG
jgi:L-iditol 2-dehydrogenase